MLNSILYSNLLQFFTKIDKLYAEDNTADIIRSGGIKDLVRISRESLREDTRNLAKKALDSNPDFSSQIHAT